MKKLFVLAILMAFSAVACGGHGKGNGGGSSGSSSSCSISGSTSVAEINEVVSFSANASGKKQSYSWSLEAPSQILISTQQTVSTSYSSAGTFGVSVTINTSKGSCVANSSITISEPPPPPPTVGYLTAYWDIPTMRDTPPDKPTQELPIDEIYGYWIYLGADSSVSETNHLLSIWVADAYLTEFTINDLPVGDWYVVMTTMDTMEQQSRISNLAIKTVQ